MPAESDPRWRHPWLRVQRLLRAMLTERWDPATWRIVRREIPKALSQCDRIKRTGWFNGTGVRSPSERP